MEKKENLIMQIMGFGEEKMACNIHPEISKRSCLKHIGDALSVAGNEE